MNARDWTVDDLQSAILDHPSGANISTTSIYKWLSGGGLSPQNLLIIHDVLGIPPIEVIRATAGVSDRGR
ncbi:MAG: hypothetical protein AAFV53_30370 [Myxococcota bacterium]